MFPFSSSTKKVEEAAELSLAEIFALHGEAYFRRLEKEALHPPSSTGAGRWCWLAGAASSPPRDTFALLCRRALTVWLRAEPEDHWNRVVKQGDRRPMDHPQAMGELRRLLRAREPLYAEAAHTIHTSKLTPEDAVAAVEALIAVAAAARAR